MQTNLFERAIIAKVKVWIAKRNRGYCFLRVFLIGPPNDRLR